MIAVSSYKPFKLSHECAINQLMARESWEDVFQKIVYFGDRCSALAGNNVEFIPSEQFPRIKDMAAYCARQPQMCAILNADIVVDPRIQMAELRMIQHKAKAATSKRYTYERIDRLADATLLRDDWGLDFFCATSDAWIKYHFHCPEQLRMGAQLWDSWSLGFFNTDFERKFVDLTPSRLIYHPNHGGRNYAPVEPFPNHYFNALGFPQWTMHI